MVVGDGAIVRSGIEALLEMLHKVAAPTGTRGSVLLMTGGLIVLGFLFLAFIFRSAIVGDLAPVANALAPIRRVAMPPLPAPTNARASTPRAFETARAASNVPAPTLDLALDALAKEGTQTQILRSRDGWKVVRVYGCSSCVYTVYGAKGCEYERGLLAGAFENVGGGLAKVHEIACRTRGDPFCDFEIRHATLRGLV